MFGFCPSTKINFLPHTSLNRAANPRSHDFGTPWNRHQRSRKILYHLCLSFSCSFYAWTTRYYPPWSPYVWYSTIQIDTFLCKSMIKPMWVPFIRILQGQVAFFQLVLSLSRCILKMLPVLHQHSHYCIWSSVGMEEITNEICSMGLHMKEASWRVLWAIAWAALLQIPWVKTKGYYWKLFFNEFPSDGRHLGGNFIFRRFFHGIGTLFTENLTQRKENYFICADGCRLIIYYSEIHIQTVV